MEVVPPINRLLSHGRHFMMGIQSPGLPVPESGLITIPSDV